MDEILKILKEYEIKNGYRCRLYFYTDGSGGVIRLNSIIINELIFQFKNTEDLKIKLKQ